MTYRLYLDERTPKTDHDWVVVRSYDEFVAHVRDHGAPNYVSFDHDLGEDSQSGYEAAKWLIDYCIELGIAPDEIEMNAHTANPVGRDNIEAVFASWHRFHAENTA